MRKWIYFLAAIAAALLSGPALPLELAMWLSGELLLYIEIVGGVWLVTSSAGLSTAVASLRQNAATFPSHLSEAVQTRYPVASSWLRGILAGA